MNKFTRYTRRLMFWFERPLPREEWQSAFNLGKVAGRNELLREQGPVIQIQPDIAAFAPQQQIQPLTVRQRALVQRLRATLKPVDQETTPVAPCRVFCCRF